MSFCLEQKIRYSQEDSHLQHAFDQVPAPHGEVREEVQQPAGEEGGQHQKEEDGQADTQQHREAHDQPLQLLVGKGPVQPLFKFGGLRGLLLRIEVRGVHQRLHAVDHGGEEVDGASDQGPAQNRMPVLDEPQLLHLLHQIALLVPDHDGLLLRAPHQNAFNECLSADAGAEGAGLGLFCHVFPF